VAAAAAPLLRRTGFSASSSFSVLPSCARAANAERNRSSAGEGREGGCFKAADAAGRLTVSVQAQELQLNALLRELYPALRTCSLLLLLSEPHRRSSLSTPLWPLYAALRRSDRWHKSCELGQEADNDHDQRVDPGRHSSRLCRLIKTGDQVKIDPGRPSNGALAHLAPPVMAAGLPVQLRLPALAGGARARAPPPRVARIAPRAGASNLRPYTIRKGDTLESIAQKRGLSVKEVVGYNKNAKLSTTSAPLGPRASALLLTSRCSRGGAGADHPAAHVQAVGGAPAPRRARAASPLTPSRPLSATARYLRVGSLRSCQHISAALTHGGALHRQGLLPQALAPTQCARVRTWARC